MAISTALNIASALIQEANKRLFPVSNMKLQKLTYLAYGLYMDVKKEKLFAEEIQAWKYGPVIPDLYHSFKLYHANPIPNGHYLVNDVETSITSEIKDLVDAVIDMHGGKSAGELVDFTHRDGTPWSKAYQAGNSNLVISDDLIRDFYEG
jgi:uncharacterized phage-associated protein